MNAPKFDSPEVSMTTSPLFFILFWNIAEPRGALLLNSFWHGSYSFGKKPKEASLCRYILNMDRTVTGLFLVQLDLYFSYIFCYF